MAGKPRATLRRSARSQKHQTRLQFSSIPALSPARDVKLEVGQDQKSDSKSRTGALLPTPDASSQTVKEENEPTSSPVNESEDEDPIQHSAKRRRVNAPATPLRRSGRLTDPSSVASHGGKRQQHGRSPSQDRGIRFSSIASAETTGDEADVFMPTPAPKRRRQSFKETKSHQSSRAKQIKDDFLVDDDEVHFMSSQDDEPPSSSRRSKQQIRPKTPRRRTREEQEELNADLEDLRDSSNEEVTITTRTRGGPVTTRRDEAREHLALLKRRRAGEKIPRVLDSDDDLDEVDSDEEGQDINLIGQPAQFIEDDTSSWANTDMPLEFTQYASAKPAELFVHVVEWLVKNKLSPAFARHDPLYQLAMQRVDDQVKAQAGSRLISSAWTATFKYTILARPNLAIEHLSSAWEADFRTCDACNMRKRPARYVFYHLNEAVLQYLEEQNLLSADSIVARDKLSNKKREKEAEAVLDGMTADGKIARLWRDFQADLDDARLGMEDFEKKGGRMQGRIGVISVRGVDGIRREWKDNRYKQTLKDSDSE
ncbi:hypothetical protein DV738_g4719, partial [Chaetothyriales sp. CBS 135597]